MTNTPAVHVVDLRRTCDARPAQWEGRTDDGRYVYVRYRWGRLQVGLGATMDAAVGDDGIDLVLGDPLDGVLTYDALVAATAGAVSWPGEEGEP